MDQGDARDTIDTVAEDALDLGVAAAPLLKPEKGGDRLEVVLHPVVDLPDDRLLDGELAVLLLDLADVAQHEDRSDLLIRGLQGKGPNADGHLGRQELGLFVDGVGDDEALLAVGEEGVRPREAFEELGKAHPAGQVCRGVARVDDLPALVEQ
ncbi:hypothetical protein D3C86_1381420 [compost metagenome]